MSKIYVFNWALQSWADGGDDWPTMESLAHPNFSNVVLAEGDKETDEAFWSAVSRLKTRVEKEYVNTCCEDEEDEEDKPQLRWVDGGWVSQEGWAHKRSFVMMDGKEFVGLVTAVISETGFSG